MSEREYLLNQISALPDSAIVKVSEFVDFQMFKLGLHQSDTEDLALYEEQEIFFEDCDEKFIDLAPMFVSLDFHFTMTTNGYVTFRDKNNQILVDFSRMLGNESFIMPIEIYDELKQNDVDRHIKNLGILSRRIIEYGDKRKVIGAIAGCVVNKEVLGYAHEQGLYVLMQNGESVAVAKTPENFALREW